MKLRRLDCTDDILAVAGLAGVGHDEELHDDVVDVGGRRLENVDVLPSHTLLYVHHRLPKVNKKNLFFLVLWIRFCMDPLSAFISQRGSTTLAFYVLVCGCSHR
jgi:hypothetical protein